MIHSLTRTIIEAAPGFAVVECGGQGAVRRQLACGHKAQATGTRRRRTKHAVRM